MEKPGKKLKKFFIITGITGMVYAGLKYLLPLVVPLLLGYTLALLLRPSARFLPDYSAYIWKKMEAITGTDRIGTVTDLSGAWKFSADFGHPPSVGRNVYFDEPASCMAGWALFLDRGKMFRS
jgi:hypothetical protein